MKKLLVLFVYTCIFLPVVHAQFDRSFRFGLTASPTLGWYKPGTADYASEGSVLGFSYGLVGDFQLGQYYAVSTGLQISYFGGKLGFRDRIPGEGDLNLERMYRVQYLEFPVTIKLQTPQIGYFIYYGRFGFAPGVNLKSTAKDSFVSGRTYTVEYDNKSDTPLFRAALIVGLGAEYALGGRVSLFGGLTYNNGFTNNLKLRNQITNRRPSANANFMVLNLGLLF